MRKLIFILIIIFCLSKNIFAENKRLRIISLAPSITEILFALGLDEEIVGVSSFCNYPKKAKDKPKVGSFSYPDIEKIILLKPDIIFSTCLEQAPVVSLLKKLNFNVYVSDPSNIEELFSSIKEIGQIVGKTKEAEELILKMRQDLEKISFKENKIRYKVFIQLWQDPLITVGKDSFIDELIYLAGGINISHYIKKPYSYFSLEELIYNNPDFIFVVYMGHKINIEQLKKTFFWKDISAIKNNQVYQDIDPDLILRPGPRIVEGLKEIYKRLHLKE